MNTNQITISIIVTGRVQGVWFRASAKNEADRLGLLGHVMNKVNGQVHIEATGESDALDAFVKWCHNGPDLARVESVEVAQIEPGQYQGFEVLP
jgi:acylphosphatase